MVSNVRMAKAQYWEGGTGQSLVEFIGCANKLCCNLRTMCRHQRAESKKVTWTDSLVEKICLAARCRDQIRGGQTWTTGLQF